MSENEEIQDPAEALRDAYAAGRIEERQEQERAAEKAESIRLFHTLGRMEEKIDSIETRTLDTKEYARDISTRVRSLEVSRGWFVGAGAGAGAFTAFLMKMILP